VTLRLCGFSKLWLILQGEADMKKHIFILITCLVLSTAYNVYGQDFKAADLWFPGSINSFWRYEVYYNASTGKIATTGDIVTDTYNSNATLDGKTYKVIQESKPFVNYIDMLDSKPDPFLTFREDEKGQILGYGRSANSDFEGIFADIMDVEFQFSWVSDEWILIPAQPFVGQTWHFTEADISELFLWSGKTSKSKYAFQGEIQKKAKIKTIAGEFDTFVVYCYDCFKSESLTNEIKNLVCVMWLAPNVGLVQISFDDKTIAGELCPAFGLYWHLRSMISYWAKYLQ
jgi:hypothetical protein